MNFSSKFSFSLVIFYLIAIQLVSAQDNGSVNWYHAQRTEIEPFNINTDQVYKTLIKNKPGRTVVVAVIDSGVDIEHEDLVNVIWTNDDEIPENGIDDDHNGYIDDVHGWNFIGGKDGTPVGADTYEMTRSYAKLKLKYNSADPTKLNPEELKEYERYNEYGSKIETESANAKKSYDEITATESIFQEVISHITEYVGTDEITANTIDSLGMSYDRNSLIAANILNAMSQELGYIPNVDEMTEMLMGEISGAKQYYGNKWKYNYNPDFDSRKIVGDNYNDLSNRYYGNNLVEGPDAMHGTHVSGIIAAERNNGIGINGIAQNVKIMVLRAVPDGDERDKDVANAIKYAVDNGADIINMSFGKGESPEKEYVDDAVRYAEKHDVLMVHAAGNSSENLDVSPNFPKDDYLKPKGFLFWKKKKATNWISVGASSRFNNENMVAGFSNYGIEDVDLFAPGEFMLSTTPNDNYEIQQGTSMAAPVVSGVAALLRSYFPQLTAQQVIEVMMESAQPIETIIKKPGTTDMVPFKALSVSGGIIDIQSAFTIAAQIKGKKKISTSKLRA
jgi:cell wall-associated protease